MTRTLKAAAAALKDWTPLDAYYSAASFRLKLHGWSQERRFVVIREMEREDKSAVGRRLIDVPGYTYRVFVTNRDEDPVTLWRDYNQRACIEQRIEELKNDLAADGFCMKQLTHPPPHGGFALRAACGCLSHLLPADSALRHRSRVPERALRVQPAEPLPASHRHAQ
jgi:hypothetical protein